MLLLHVLFTGSLQINALTSQITRKEAEKAVSKWLIGARDRGGTGLRGHTESKTGKSQDMSLT